MDVIRAYMPDYVILVVVRQRVGVFVDDPTLGSSYHPIRRFNASNENPCEGLTPRPKGLPVTWRQDYIVYERAEP